MIMLKNCSAAFAVSLASLALATQSCASENASSADWPQWRGAHRNGVADEKNWSSAWPKEGPPQLWKAEVGTGFASVAVSHGRAYTLGNSQNRDTVFCLDANSGAPVWKHTYACELEPNSHAGGPGSTPAVDGDWVYTFSKKGHIFCLDAATGKVRWQKNVVADFGAKSPTWAFSSSPLIDGDRVLLNVFASGLALNKNTGALIWKGTGVSGYASPVLFNRAEGTGVVFFGTDALFGVNAEDGKTLWTYPWPTKWGENTPDPICVHDHLYVSTGHGLGAALLKLSDQAAPQKVWENKAIGNHISTPVLYNEFLYGFTGLVHRKGATNLSCVDFKTGEIKWTQPGLLGQLILSNGKLLMLTVDGVLIAAEATPEKYIELARAKVLESKEGEGKSPPKKCWTPPVLSAGRIYCRNASGELVCLDVSK
jgi:outer membrane protein assembly factor BamB